MMIGDRLRAMRQAKNISQGEVEKRTGLLRCYISRVENGHTVPAIETLEKFARAMEVPLYQLFYEGGETREIDTPSARPSMDDSGRGSSGRDGRVLFRLRQLLGRISSKDRDLLLFIAQQMVKHQTGNR
jgi:transcriptional regulator with XRE-family HTH domain